MMKLSDFNYNLPEELIAQDPLEKRDNSRLMVLHRETGELEHKHFYDVIDYLNPGDCLVVNIRPSALYRNMAIRFRNRFQSSGTGRPNRNDSAAICFCLINDLRRFFIYNIKL